MTASRQSTVNSYLSKWCTYPWSRRNDRKNKRPSGAQLQKSPGRMTGRLLRLWVWELFPTRQKAKRIYAAPACDLASGGLFALLAINFLSMFLFVQQTHLYPRNSWDTLLEPRPLMMRELELNLPKLCYYPRLYCNLY